MEQTLPCLPGGFIDLEYVGPTDTEIKLKLWRSGVPDHGDPGNNPLAVGTVNPNSFKLLGPDSPIKVRFQAPRVSGLIEIDPSSPATVRYKVDVKLTGFKSLIDLPTEQLIALNIDNATAGSRTAKDGLPLLVEAIGKLGLAFYTKFDTTLRIGNMSFHEGGLIDVNNDWSPPCEDHGEGKSVDILMKEMTEDQRAWIKENASDFGFQHNLQCGAVYGDPWHLTLSPDSAMIKPLIVAHSMGTTSRPGLKIPRSGAPYIARLAITDEGGDPSDPEPPPPAITLSSKFDETARNPPSGADDCIMMLEFKLSISAIREGVATITMPSSLVAFNKDLQALASSDFRVDFKNPEGGLKSLASGSATVFIKALATFQGGEIVFAFGPLHDELKLMHIDLVPATGRKLFIQPHRHEGNPEMPRLVARLAQGTSAQKVRWRLRVQYDRGNGERANLDRPEDCVDIPGRLQPDQLPSDENTPSLTAPIPGNVEWSIFDSEEWKAECGKGLFGGLATVWHCIDGQPETQFSQFQILGLNPDNRLCRAWIETYKINGRPVAAPNAELWFAYAIAKHETSEWSYRCSLYHQFIGRIRNKNFGFPAWNNDYPHDKTKPGGYGVFQITANAISRAIIWNWQENVIAGIKELLSKQREASKWMKDQRVEASGVALPPISVRNVAFVDGTDRTMTDLVAMKHYNGSSTPPDGFSDNGKVDKFIIDPHTCGYYCYWKDEGEEQKGWALSRYNSRKSNYVDLIMRMVDEKEGIAQKTIDACKYDWEANKKDCNLFVKAVAFDLDVPISSDGDADETIDFLAGSSDWKGCDLFDGRE